MPRKKRKPAAKVGRPAKPVKDRKRHVLSIRVQDQLHSDLTKSASANGRSISDEISYRLNSALHEEQVLGGPELRSLVNTMIADFTVAGRREAEWILGPGTPDGVWLKDISCYDAAFLSLVEVLLLSRPDPSLDEVAKFLFGRLQARIAQHYLNKDLRKKESEQ